MREQDMKSACSQTSLDILASSSLNHMFFKTEKLFQDLSLEEKLDIVMSYQPEIFQVETTTRCNLNCPLCSTHRLKRGYTETRLELVDRILVDNPQMSYICLHLMGEPLLSNSIFSIIGYLTSRDIYTYFSTNGMLLDKNVPAIIASGLKKISVSLDGINQEDLALYRINADLGKILKGIRRLREERKAQNLNHPLIQIQTIMFGYNEVKEVRVVDFLKSLGVDRVKLKKPGFDTFGMRNGGGERFTRTAKDPGSKYSRDRESYIKYRERSICRLLFQGFALSDGSVIPCCIDYDGQNPFGNLNNQSWREIWGSEKRRKVLTNYFLRELEICKKCSLGYGYSTTVFDQRL